MSSINNSRMRCGAAAVAHIKALMCVEDTRLLSLLKSGLSFADLVAVAEQMSLGTNTISLDTGMSINAKQIMDFAGINVNQVGNIAAKDMLISLADDLKPVEEMVFTNAIQSALGNLEYQSRIEVGEHFTAIEAVKGHETMLLLVDGPDILTDQIGLSGTTCVEKQEDFQKALAREGVKMELHLKKHLDPKGGEYSDLIKSAARMHSGSLAKGVVDYVRENPKKNPMGSKKMIIGNKADVRGKVSV